MASGTRDGCNDACRGIDLADAVVVAIGDIEVACAVRGYAPGVVQLRDGSQAAVPAESAVSSGTRDGGNDACRDIDLADAVVVAIGNIDVACAVRGYAPGLVQLRSGC